MSDFFSFRRGHRIYPKPAKRRVLVTGGAGNIGSFFAEHSHERYELTLMVHPDVDPAPVEDFGRVVRSDLADLDRLKTLFRGIDTVVHLAADPSAEAVWASVLQNNIIGTYNAFTAAAAVGCRRVVYASSIHAVSGYPAGRQVEPDDPVNPGDLYGVSKCFGEAMARFISTQHDTSCLVIRIGGFQPADHPRETKNLRNMAAFVAKGDLKQLLCCCIDNEDLQFAICHGLSDNRFNRMNIESTRELVGYTPQMDYTLAHPALKELNLRGHVPPHSEKGGQKTGLREELDEENS